MLFIGTESARHSPFNGQLFLTLQLRSSCSRPSEELRIFLLCLWITEAMLSMQQSLTLALNFAKERMELMATKKILGNEIQERFTNILFYIHAVRWFVPQNLAFSFILACRPCNIFIFSMISNRWFLLKLGYEHFLFQNSHISSAI